MNLHDWTRVEDSTFHDFHTGWVVHLKEALNDGRLPKGYYAQAEQHVGRKVADVLALHVSDPDAKAPLPPIGERAVAVAVAPPRVSRSRVIKPSQLRQQRTLTIRHKSGHRIIALVEIVSQANKASATSVAEFVGKIAGALRTGIHCGVLDVLPPGRHDPHGMHEAVMEAFGDKDDEVPNDKPLTFASYVAQDEPTAYLQHLAVGDPIPDVPVFLTPDHYVELPLTTTYAAAFRGMPEYWREVLERTP
jgi:hypothetical protein